MQFQWIDEDTAKAAKNEDDDEMQNGDREDRREQIKCSVKL